MFLILQIPEESNLTAFHNSKPTRPDQYYEPLYLYFHYQLTMTGNADIPVIDISNPSQAVAQKVLDAATSHGFLFIKNDGVTIPPKDIDNMFQLVSLSSYLWSKRR